MKNVKAFRKSFDYLDTQASEKYLLFLKQHFTNSKPNYYCVATKNKVNTPDGIMYAIRIDLELADPKYEPIAEIWINGHYMYFWRDHCWTIAKDKNNNDIVNYQDGGNLFSKKHEPRNKTMVIHQVGTDPVFEEPYE